MPVTKLPIADFLDLSSRAPILDVRSPGEYNHARMPFAVSFPIFDDAERKVIGTAYKQESREKAIKIGLGAFGKNMVSIVEEAEKILAAKHNHAREIGLHCWRGGMRSGAMAWLLDLYGFKVYTLNGGYKAYRHWILQQFEKPWRFHVLGGYTGSNKTGIIAELKKRGENAIDLEGLAGHRGSAFGNLEKEAMPTQEMFENLLGTALSKYDLGKEIVPVWIEDESQRIGDINLPSSLFKTLRGQPFLFLDIPFEQRLQHVLDQYGRHDKEKFINAILRIKKRLGGLEAKQAINFILEDDLKSCFAVLLNYYDKIYARNRLSGDEAENKQVIPLDSTDAALNIKTVLEHVRNN